jgi:hypothetical protein
MLICQLGNAESFGSQTVWAEAKCAEQRQQTGRGGGNLFNVMGGNKMSDGRRKMLKPIKI